MAYIQCKNGANPINIPAGKCNYQTYDGTFHVYTNQDVPTTGHALANFYRWGYFNLTGTNYTTLYSSKGEGNSGVMIITRITNKGNVLPPLYATHTSDTSQLYNSDVPSGEIIKYVILNVWIAPFSIRFA